MKEDSERMKKERMEKYLYQLAGGREEFFYNIEKE